LFAHFLWPKGPVPALCGHSDLFEVEVGMTGDYPRFRTSYSHDEWVEHFLLTPTEQELIAQGRGDVNRHGVAVLLKSLHYLGYVPESPPEVPPDVKTVLARQLHLLWDPSAQYPTDERTQRYHLAWIRQHTGWRANSRTPSCSNCCSSRACAMLNSCSCVPPMSICRRARSASHRGKATRIARCC